MAFDDYENSDTEGDKVELYLFETPDGIHRWGYATSASRVPIGLFGYEPEVITRSEIKQSVGEGPQRVTVTLPYDLPVCAMHVPYLPPNPFKLTIFEFHRGDPAQQLRQIFIGYVTNFAQNGEYADLECSTVLDNVKQMVPWATYKAGCNWALYGIGCYVNKLPFEVTVNDINLVTADLIGAPSIAAKGDGWFTNGYAVHPESGESRFIISNVAGKIRFNYPFRDVDATSVLKIYAGCDRQRTTCKNKFGNILNYLGWDWFPTKNVFQTGVN